MSACSTRSGNNFAGLINAGCADPELECPVIPFGLTSIATDLNANAAGEIAAGAVSAITVLPARAMDGKRMVVASSVARHFVITDILVSGQSILPGNVRPIPAEMLSEVAVDAMLRARGIEPNNQSLQINIQNIDTLMAHRFLAGLWATSLSGR